MNLFKALKKVRKVVKSKKAAKVFKAAKKIKKVINTHTKEELTNAALASVATYVRHATKDLEPDEVQEVTKEITCDQSEDMKLYKLAIDPQGTVKMSSPIGKVAYDWNDGTVKWGKSITF